MTAKPDSPASTVERVVAEPMAVFPRDADPVPEARVLARWLAARGDSPELIDRLKEGVRQHGRPIRMAIAGGEDTPRVDLINALLGRRVVPYEAAVPHLIRHGDRARARAIDRAGRATSVGFVPGRSLVASKGLDPVEVQRVDVKAPLDALRRITLLDGGTDLGRARDRLAQVVAAELLVLLPVGGDWPPLPKWVVEGALPVIAVFTEADVSEPLTDWSCRCDARAALRALGKRDAEALGGSGLNTLVQTLQAGPFLQVAAQRDRQLTMKINEVIADAEARTRVAVSVARLRRDEALETRQLEAALHTARTMAETSAQEHTHALEHLRATSAQVETALTARVEELERGVARGERVNQSLRRAHLEAEAHLARANHARASAVSDVDEARAALDTLRAQADEVEKRHRQQIEEAHAQRKTALEAQAAQYARMLEEAQSAAAHGSELAEQMAALQRSHAEARASSESAHSDALSAARDEAEADLSRSVASLTAERDDIVSALKARHVAEVARIEEDHASALERGQGTAESERAEAVGELETQLEQLRTELSARSEQLASLERAHAASLEEVQRAMDGERAELAGQHRKSARAATEANQQIIMEMEGRLSDATTKSVNNELRVQQLKEQLTEMRAKMQHWDSVGPDEGRADAWTSAPPRPIPPELITSDRMPAIRVDSVIGRIGPVSTGVPEPGRIEPLSADWPSGTPAPIEATPVPAKVGRRLDRARELHARLGSARPCEILGVEENASEIRLREAHAQRLREFSHERFARFDFHSEALHFLSDLEAAVDAALGQMLGQDVAFDDTLDGSGGALARELMGAIGTDDVGVDSSFGSSGGVEVGSLDTAPPTAGEPVAGSLDGQVDLVAEPPDPSLLDVTHATLAAAQLTEHGALPNAVNWWRAIRRAEDGAVPRCGEIYCVYVMASRNSPDRVATALEALAEASRGSPLPYLYLGRVLRDMRERQRAIAAYEAALAVDPTCRQAGDELHGIWRRDVGQGDQPAATGWGEE